MTVNAAIVVVFKDTAGEWRWTARDTNYELVADGGEGYKRHADALAAATSRFPDATLEDDSV